MSKLLCGVAFNSGGKYRTGENSKPNRTYIVWRNMIERCYSERYQARYPTYIGCSVADDWCDFQAFAEWYANHKYSDLGYDLDKDLLTPSNKIYSSITCCFVPQELNKILTDSRAARSKNPQGVSFNKPMGKYFASMKVDGKKQHLGYFDCPQEAYDVYKSTKERHVKKKALEWQDKIASDVFDALMQWSLDS